MNSLFYKCSSLKYLPEISKWDLNKVNNIDHIFSDCSSLNSLPDLSKWNTNNIIHMTSIFENCSSLKNLPDISNWKLNKVQDISNLFKGCSSLLAFPDISKWNINYLCNIHGLFYGCSSVISFPDITKWNISLFIKDSDIFDIHSFKSSEISNSIFNPIPINDESNNIHNIFKDGSSMSTSSLKSVKKDENNIKDSNISLKIKLPNLIDINLIYSFVSSLGIPKLTNDYIIRKEIFIKANFF